METSNPSGGDTQLKQTGTGHVVIVKVINSSGESAEVRKASTGHLQRAGGFASFSQLAPGAALHIPAPTAGVGAIEFRLPNGRTLVQAVDARTTRVDLVRDGDGTYRTEIASAPARAAKPPAKSPAKPPKVRATRRG
jgi:hypothetical protein